MKEIPLIFIVGPTAVGKSEIGLALARHLNGEIVCCDAMQVYREIAIASDKPSTEIRAEVKHHVLDIVSVTQDFNVARYRQLASSAIENIFTRNKTPLIVGGSGMYMSVLLDGIFEKNISDGSLREELTQQASVNGLGVLHERLKVLDPQAAEKIHPNDTQRIIRALEVALTTGEPITKLQPKREGIWGKMPIKIFALNRPREELYQRAEARVEEMFAKGLVDEIKQIASLPLSVTAGKVIGVPEVIGYLKNEHDLSRAKYLMKLNTRHYIKRQLTWFRRDKRLTWIDIVSGQSAQQIAGVIAGLID
ncbi:MAG: tRNA (adenosine(37)-N6)-dimethylallyltransferase MiaA [Candidatus Omnitrophica bacterium]|nr:tRNA (adenosine(37)-N6)-dimethylallyltransferase MiaA [Candidatus Omnitrophota bacterium]